MESFFGADSAGTTRRSHALRAAKERAVSEERCDPFDALADAIAERLAERLLANLDRVYATGRGTSGPSEVMTTEEVAQYLKCSTGTVHRLARESKLPRRYVGDSPRYRREDVRVWLEASQSPRKLPDQEG